MDKRSLFILLIISLCILTTYFFLLNVKFSFEVDLPVKFEQLSLEIKNITYPLGFIRADIEYSDDNCVIYGIRAFLLPIRNGSKINLQGAIRKHDGFSTLVIGYPALPLESY